MSATGERVSEDQLQELQKQYQHSPFPVISRGLVVSALSELQALRQLLRESKPALEWQPIESAPKDGLIDLCAGERIYSQCYYDSICDEYRRLDHWNRLEMLKLRNGFTHWRRSQLPALAHRAGELT